MFRGKARVWLAVSAILAVLMVLSACGGGNALVGKWTDPTGVLVEFTGDGKVIVSSAGISINGTYTLPDATHVKLDLSSMGESISQTFTYAIAGDKLTMTDEDGSATEFTRSK